MTIEDLFLEIDNHFLTKEKLDYIITLTENHEQDERWFTKRQLLPLFDSLVSQGRLSNCKREAFLKDFLPPLAGQKPSEEQIDFMVTLDQQPIPLEVKILYLGPQGKSKKIPISLYFDRNPQNGYIAADVYKLEKIGYGYDVLFVYPFPDPQLWVNNVERFAQNMEPLGIKVEELGVGPLGIPDQRKYSPHLYIAKLEVSRL